MIIRLRNTLHHNAVVTATLLKCSLWSRVLLSPFSSPFSPSNFPFLFWSPHPLHFLLPSPCSPLSPGLAGPAAPGAFSCLQLSLYCLPVGRHQEGAAGSCKTWCAREVSAPTSLIPITHFLIHRVNSLIASSPGPYPKNWERGLVTLPVCAESAYDVIIMWFMCSCGSKSA